MRRDALTANGKVRLEWLPPLRRMTRCARELERVAAHSDGSAPEHVRQTATVAWPSGTPPEISSVCSATPSRSCWIRPPYPPTN